MALSSLPSRPCHDSACRSGLCTLLAQTLLRWKSVFLAPCEGGVGGELETKRGPKIASRHKDHKETYSPSQDINRKPPSFWQRNSTGPRSFNNDCRRGPEPGGLSGLSSCRCPGRTLRGKHLAFVQAFLQMLPPLVSQAITQGSSKKPMA